MTSRARDYRPGETVPGTVYQVVRLIGAGGMGTVYDVEDTTIGKLYVLKTLHPQLGDREDLARRMKNEARTLARLNHTNIVEVITAGVTSDELKLPYYVMERLNGQSLRMVLEKRGQLELPHAYHVGIDLLDALDHAHDKGVIHRDVKPDNIFLHRTSAGVTVTKLLDFGILSLLDAANRETAGRFLGTLRYAAPEQLRGEKPTAKVDVYAAGLVIYEMVCGRGPFDDEGDHRNVAAAHLHKVALPLSHFVVVPRELDRLISAALAKDPAQRPRDAFSMAASLRNLKKALAGAKSPESTENRATAAAVMPGESAASPLVQVHQAAADGPYIISPVAGATPPGTQPGSAPNTTQRGMPTPSMGPSLVEMSSTATPPESVDRTAPTRSFVPDVIPAQPQWTAATDTEPHAAATLPSGPPPAQTPVAFRWPPEQALVRSEEPQVRTVTGRAAPGPPRSGSSVVAVLLLIGAMAVASLTLLVMRLRSPSSAGVRPATAVAATVQAPPPPLPVAALPGPTLSPPAFDAPPAALTASPSASATASATAAHASASAPVPGTKPIVSAARAPAAYQVPSRPGPGF